MSDGDPLQDRASDTARVGERLRTAREEHGLSLAEVAARTRIPLRHLEALEAGSYDSLPSPTYAVGFSRAYARTVGADEVAVARDVRADLDRLGPRQAEYVPYEITDPSRVPSRGLAIVAASVALAVLVLALIWFATDWLRPGGASNRQIADATVAAAPAAAPAAVPAATPTPAGAGQVTLTANDEVWLRVYDAAGKTLFIGTMKPGDRFDVPPTADDPKINVGRPDKLSVTLNGSAIPPLGDGSRPIKDVRVSAAAVAARLQGGGTTPTAATAPATPGAARPTPSPSFAPLSEPVPAFNGAAGNAAP